MKTLLLLSAVILSSLSFSLDDANLKEAMETGVSIAAGPLHNCALSDEGKVTKCWGEGSHHENEVPPSLPKIIQVSLGNEHSCALSEAGKVICWGSNLENQSSVPGSNIKQISAAGQTTCTLSSVGIVRCYGINSSGQNDVPYLPEIKQISAGWYASCALSVEGKVKCWGLQESIPAVPELPKIKQIGTGMHHACALSEEGKIFCWGSSSRDGQADVPSSLPKIKQISVGYFFTCAVAETGKVYCWGRHDGGTLPSVMPTEMQSVTAGGFHACGKMDGDEILCWGDNNYKQLGVPHEVSELQAGITPVKFNLQSLEKSFYRIAKKIYSYKANYVKGLAALITQLPIDEKLPVAAEYKKYLARYFALEMLSPLVETTDTPFIKEKVVMNLKKELTDAKKSLELSEIQDIELGMNTYKISLMASRLAIQNSAQFLLNEDQRKDAELLLTKLGELEVQLKSNGYTESQAKELLNLLETNPKLIQTLSVEARTTGFGATLEKIKNYLKEKV